MKSPLKLVVFLITAALLSSCGGGDTIGGAGQFKTVQASATASKTRLESDIVTTNSCTTGISSGGTILTDTVDVTVSATAFPNVTNPSPIFVDSMTVSYAPNITQSTSAPPALSPVFFTSIGQAIKPGGALTIPVAIAPDKVKIDLLDKYNFPLCSTTIWSYYVTITLETVEQSTGTRRELKTSMDLSFADRT